MRAIKPGERGRIAVLFWSGRGQVSKQTARDLVFRTRMDTIRSWFDFSFEVTDESGRTVLLMLFDEVVPDPQARSA